MFFLFSFLFSLYAQGEKNTIIAYSKNCAVSPDGRLLEEVWKVIPDERLFASPEEKELPLDMVVKAVYEREYLCFALKMKMTSFHMAEAMKNKKNDFVDVILKDPYSKKSVTFSLTPLWVTSSWKQDKINPSGVKQARKYYSAEVRIPLFTPEDAYYKGREFFLTIKRRSLSSSGKVLEGVFTGKLLLGDLAYTDNRPRSNTKIWRNGELNTFFKRPNPRWNSNWDLGKGDYLQQGWNLNQAKGMGRFEVFAHEDKEDDYYVVLRNGDFYQMYKGLEKKMSYTFQAKGKGILKVRFLRFAFKNHALRLLGVLSERVIHIDSDEWKTYKGTVEKTNENESLALDFATENSEIMLDEAYMRGIK